MLYIKANTAGECPQEVNIKVESVNEHELSEDTHQMLCEQYEEFLTENNMEEEPCNVVHFKWMDDTPSNISSNFLKDYKPGTVLKPKNNTGRSPNFLFKIIDAEFVEVVIVEHYIMEEWNKIIPGSRYCELFWDLIYNKYYKGASVFPIKKFSDFDDEENRNITLIEYATEIKCTTVEEGVEKTLSFQKEIHKPLEVLMIEIENMIKQELDL
jgi:hypothetical protein